jgi:hypothetical protein
LRRVEERAKRENQGVLAYVARHAFGDVREETESVETRVTALIARLPRGDLPKAVVRRMVPLDVIEELAELGPAAAEAVPALERTLKGVYVPGTRPNSAAIVTTEALCRIDRPSGKRVGLLTVSLRPPQSSDPAEPGIPDSFWNRGGPERVRRAALALSRIVPDMPSAKMRGQVAERALAALTAFGDRDPQIQQALLGLLESLGPDAAPAAGEVSAMLEQAESRWQALLANPDVGEAQMPEPGHRATILVCMGARFGLPLAARHRLVRLLGRMGSGARDATPVLQKLRDTDDPLLRYEAALALRRIGD